MGLEARTGQPQI